MMWFRKRRKVDAVLAEKIRRGIADLEAGRSKPLGELKAELRGYRFYGATNDIYRAYREGE
jgi:hypothetical protein